MITLIIFAIILPIILTVIYYRSERSILLSILFLLLFSFTGFLLFGLVNSIAILYIDAPTESHLAEEYHNFAVDENTKYLITADSTFIYIPMYGEDEETINLEEFSLNETHIIYENNICEPRGERYSVEFKNDILKYLFYQLDQYYIYLPEPCD